ncbi:MAG TPA: hypothetical protein VKU80_04455 [Planctomycetota bacterium]|nr:hypothetical protein [Planctomycetota bacterium]
MSRCRLVSGACLALVGGLGAAIAIAVVRTRAAVGGTPYWDEASHGLQGFVILQDITQLDLRHFLGDVFGTHFRYPFGHSLLLVPAYALFGPSWLTAVGVSAFLFVVLSSLLYLGACRFASDPYAPGTGTPQERTEGAAWAAGLMAATLGLTSPAFLSQASTILLEMPALVMSALLLWLYGRALDAPDTVGRIRAVGWTLTAYVLTASQYATVWIFTVATYEAWRLRPEERRAVWDWAKGVLKSRAAFHPLHLMAAVLFACALAILASGGWNFTLGTHTLSLVHPGTPLTLGTLTLGVRSAWLVWRHRDALRAKIAPRHQAYFFSLVVPLFVWFFVVYPMRLTHYLNWVTQSPQQFARSSLDYWTFYPRFLFHTAAASTPVFVALLALVALGLIARNVPEKVRFLRWAVVVTALIVTAHGARQTRFILPFLPAGLLLASSAVAPVIRRLRSPGLRWALSFAAAGAILALVVPAAPSLYQEGLRSLEESSFTPEALGYREILRRISDEAIHKPSVRILGTFPGLSHHLFEWELRRRADLRNRELSFDITGPSENPQQVYERWLSNSPEELVFTIEPIDLQERIPAAKGGPAEVSQDTYAHMRLLRGTERFGHAGEWLYPAAGLRVVEYALLGERPLPQKRTKHRADR